MILMSQIEEAFSARPFGFQVSPGLAAAGLKLVPPLPLELDPARLGGCR